MTTEELRHMITEDKIIELAKSVQSDESDKKQELVMMYPNEVIAFANALRDEFIKSLGDPVAMRFTTASYKLGWRNLDKELVEAANAKGGIIFDYAYALPNDKEVK